MRTLAILLTLFTFSTFVKSLDVDEHILKLGPYASLVSQVYTHNTKGWYPRLEECAGMNFRCFVELNTMYLASENGSNPYDTLARVQPNGSVVDLAAFDGSDTIINEANYTCDDYITWITDQIEPDYRSNVDYCAAKGDIRPVWQQLGINRKDALSQTTSGDIELKARYASSDEKDCLDEWSYSEEQHCHIV